MKAELIDRMGTDLSVVNSARVSFDKESEWDISLGPVQTEVDYDARSVIEWQDKIYSLSKKDQKLITYLAKHNHWTPFSHVMITMRETVPVFVARQRFKHVVGFTYNEVSRRYVDDEPEFYIPDVWRKRAENKKQGSSDETIDGLIIDEIYFPINSIYNTYIEACKNIYNSLIENDIAPEQARMLLPQSMYTSYYVTGSLAAWARAYNLRSEEHAQKEIQDLAAQWNDIISGIDELKYSWEALTTIS